MVHHLRSMNVLSKLNDIKTANLDFSDIKLRNFDLKEAKTLQDILWGP